MLQNRQCNKPVQRVYYLFAIVIAGIGVTGLIQPDLLNAFRASRGAEVVFEVTDCERSQVFLVSDVMLSESSATDLKTHFRIRNRSGSPHDLVFVNKNCSCFGVEIDGKPATAGDCCSVPPGEAASVALIVKVPRTPWAKNYLAQFKGKISESENVALALSFSLRVVGDIQCSPDALICDFTRSQTAEITREVTVSRGRRGAGGELSSEPLISNLPNNAKIHRIERAGKPTDLGDNIQRESWIVTLGISPPQSQDEPAAADKLTVSFSDSNRLQAQLALLCRNKRGLLYPKIVNFGRVEAASTSNGNIARRILIESDDNTPFSIIESNVSSGQFSIAATPNEESTRHSINLFCDPSIAGQSDGDVILSTTHPLAPSITIKLRAIVTRSAAQESRE